MLRAWIKKILAYGEIEAAYLRNEGLASAEKIMSAILSDWEITVKENNSPFPLKNKDKGTLIVANHPFGGIEGMILSTEILRKDEPLKFLVNPVLHSLKYLREVFLFVSPYSDKVSQKNNISATKQALMWLKKGMVLGMFPSGEVSSLNLKHRCVVDPKWNESCALFIRSTQCQVLPIFFSGRNSAWFQFLGLIHPKLRTLLLGREMLNKSKKTVVMNYGSPVAFSQLPKHLDRKGLASYLRFLTYSISKQSETEDLELKASSAVPIAQAGEVTQLIEEMHALPKESFLLESKNFQVYLAEHSQIPCMMHEISRQREISFRHVGEGTGKSLDADAFDVYYKHLFVWDKDAKKLVGAYRFALSDEVKANGKEFYSKTLFDFDSAFLKTIEPAIELGRSFVALDYQKSFAPLLLLWKGIGQFISRNPKYTQLFGPVSISGEFSGLSKTILKQFLLEHHGHPQLKSMIEVKQSLEDPSVYDYSLNEILGFFKDLKDVSNFIDYQEKKFNGVPILIKHYIRLGAKFLDFSVDPEFNDTLDALIVVDLLKTDEKILKNYMGEKDYHAFKAFHQA